MRLDEVETATTDAAANEGVQPTGWRERAQTIAARIDWAAVALGVTVLVGLYLRLYNLNWDNNAHLHPDERKITMVAMCLGLKSVPAGCPPVPDPANPHFFAYGSFPMYLLALVSHGLATIFAHWKGLPTDGGTFDDYNHITLVGRALSAIFDTGTVLVTGLLARRLVGRWWGVFAAAFVAFTAFEVQLAHFYAVDTVLTFFVTLTLFGAVGLALGRKGDGDDAALPPIIATIGWGLLTGLAFGLAVTSKISALPLVVPIALALVIRWRRLGLGAWPDIALAAIALVTTAFVAIILTMPYAFLDSVDFWHDVNEQSALSSGKIVYPYTIQFANTTPYLYQIKNIFIWDLGVPLAVVGFAGLLYALVRLWRRWDDVLLIPAAWVVIYFAITGNFYTKFSRYELPIFPTLAVLAAVGLAALSRNEQLGTRWAATRRLVARLGAGWTRKAALGLAVVVVLCGGILTLAFLNIYTQPVTRVSASQWIYQHVPAGSTITSEIWDDSLPLQVGVNYPNIYQYEGLDLYQPDTTDKATTVAGQLAKADVVVIASSRLVGSINKEPGTYPMTVNYYKQLYAGQLGFTLTKMFVNYPHLGPFALHDSPDTPTDESYSSTNADESYSVYDHPTVWIFTRTGPRLTTDQIQQRLLAGVSLPPTVTSLASQKPLLLTSAQQAANAKSPPLWQVFNPAGWATKLALPLWWLAVEILGLLVFPILFLALPGLRDRGWGLSKALGILLLSFLIWLPGSFGLIPYERATVWLVALVMAVGGGALFWWRRVDLLDFWREHRRLIITTEVITLAAFLFFVAIRSLDPDLWHIYRGGEKPMELTFLDGILRSRTLPPIDPWFANGYINYYYFGQFLIATLIQLTGIVPTTAFNLAIPLLFALTISGAMSVVGGIARHWWVGVAGGLFLSVAGNLDGLRQFIIQIQASQAHLPVPPYDYWSSSRIIPFTINEFPFWSFLYADFHAHVIDLPFVLLGLGVAASLLNSANSRWRILTLAVGALTLGAMACINTWDAPTYGLLIVLALLVAEWHHLSTLAAAKGGGWRARLALLNWPFVRRVSASVIGLAVGAIVLYLPFYTHYQSFVNGTGPVTTTTDQVQFLTIFGVWLFLIVTFYLVEIRDRWEARIALRWPGGEEPMGDSSQRMLAVTIAGVIVLTFLVLGGVKLLLIGLIGVTIYLLVTGQNSPMKQFTFLLVLAGLGVTLLVEVIYLRDFLDGSDYERMNSVFKFYYQAWLLFALGAALAFGQIVGRMAKFDFSAVKNPFAMWSPQASVATPAVATPTGPLAAVVAEDSVQHLPASSDDDDGNAEFTEWPAITEVPTRSTEDAVVGIGLRGAWLGITIFLLLASSIFLFEGTQARLQDRTDWGAYQVNGVPVPRTPVNSLPTVPSLDGFAYMHSWYPGDADAITWINEHIGGTPTLLEARI